PGRPVPRPWGASLRRDGLLNDVRHGGNLHPSTRSYAGAACSLGTDHGGADDGDVPVVAGHPFTAPPRMPRMKYRWSSSRTANGRSTDASAAAAMVSWPWPVACRSPAICTVKGAFALPPPRKSNGVSRSFQDQMNWSMA